MTNRPARLFSDPPSSESQHWCEGSYEEWEGYALSLVEAGMVSCFAEEWNGIVLWRDRSSQRPYSQPLAIALDGLKDGGYVRDLVGGEVVLGPRHPHYPTVMN